MHSWCSQHKPLKVRGREVCQSELESALGQEYHFMSNIRTTLKPHHGTVQCIAAIFVHKQCTYMYNIMRERVLYNIIQVYV